ncbi:DUF4256 domain-containing protein [Alkalibacterium sp. 20]|uniref:DUF4256 domain-containing protein n=1 Tax=Alkalibacterium sp. 20 TaxID=1798803 RepID=UPI0008FFE3AE|nr:DUF4256 domain-containing protein [Alkalibacterium sp. 20]OJF94159.1 hypothetical protein AX762_07975 [Alkalibacterium sp. 20]
MNKEFEMRRTLSTDEKSELLAVLKTRFDKNMKRHKNMEWHDVLDKLESNEQALISLQAMEQTKGEPDVIESGSDSVEILFIDCSEQTPSGRRKVCYDDLALESRKKYPPEASAVTMAKEIGVELLDETQYRTLQKLGEFDTKTSSWIQTPEKIRKLGGALFCDRRYDSVFVYHNGAESYYASRGFRGSLKV